VKQEALAAASASGTPRHTLWLFVLCLALRAVSFARPCLSDDEATYCVVGREMLSGRVLYRDVVDHKPPLIYVTYAVTQALGGPIGGMIIIHLLTALVVFSTAALLAFVVRRFTGSAVSPRAPFFAALLYVVFTTTLFSFDALAANCELYMMLPLVGSVALYLCSAAEMRLRPSLLAGAGALVGLAMFYKYQGGIHLALYGLHSAWLHRRHPWRVLAVWGALGAGCAAILGLGVAALVHFDAWRAGWFWFRFNFAYIRDGMSRSEVVARAVPRISFVVGGALFLWVLGLGAALRVMRGRTLPDESDVAFDRFAVGWLLVSAFAVTAGGRFFGHYFHQITAPLAVLAAPRAARLWGARRKLVVAALAVPAAAFFLLGIGQPRVMAVAGQPEPDYAAMTAFIQAHSQPDDGLFVWGNLPVLYFDAGRPLGSRFAFANYLTGLSPATRSQSDPSMDTKANIVPESWDMLEADLAQRRPRLFVDTSPGDVGHYGKFPPASFPQLQTILDRDYRSLGEVAGVRVFERRPSLLLK
jgi:4-amino-4-deoxy-L-arabinose transferase-like glycosyltransferase